MGKQQATKEEATCTLINEVDPNAVITIQTAGLSQLSPGASPGVLTWKNQFIGAMKFDKSQGYGSYSYEFSTQKVSPDYRVEGGRVIPFWGAQPYESLSSEDIKKRRASDSNKQNNQKRFLLIDLGSTLYYLSSTYISKHAPDFDQPWRAGEAFWRMEGSCSGTVLGDRFIW